MIKSKFEWYLLSIISFIEALSVLLTNKSLIKTIDYNIKENNYSYGYGLFILFVGCIFLYIGYKKEYQQEQYTKCPKCKEVFNYKDLKDGKCPYCEDTDTIDLDEYFKKYPEELENNTK